MSQNRNYSRGGGGFNYNGSTSKNTQQQQKQSQGTENIKTKFPQVTSQRRLRFKPETHQSGKNFKKKMEVINKSAKVFSEVFQKEVSASPHFKFVRNSEAIDDSDDEDDNDDNSSVYSSTNDILSQPGDMISELSQASCSDSFYNLSQPDYNSTRKIRQLPATKLPFLIPQLYPKCAIFWDIENCPLPSGKSAISFVKSMRDTHCKDHEYTEDKFLVVCDTSKLAVGVSLDLQNSLVKLEHVSGTSKNAADECLRRNMREFAENNVAPAKIVIITGDINFNSELHDMRYKRHFNVVLIHNRQTSEALKALASECYEFEEFCMNLPEVQTNQNTGPVVVQVNNLPHNVERRRVHGRLARLVKNFGGRILNLNDYRAYVQFPSRNDAIRAQSSLRGEDVHGSKIALQVITINTERNCTDESKISDKRSNENKNEGEEEPKQNVQVEQNRNTCFVSFCVNESMSFNQLRSAIQNEIGKFESLELHSKEGNKNCYLMKCESLNWGRKAVKILNQMTNPQLYDVQLLRNKSDGGIRKTSTVEEITVLEKCFRIKQSSLDKHKTKMTALRKRLSNSPIGNEVLQKRYNILFDIEKEFQQTTNGLLDSITNGSKINDPEDKILFESSQISRTCPVYAYRSKIVQSFTINPVTILTGIPGSGKSTQVVQYIFQEMSSNIGSNNWKIVCTQPHKSLVKKFGSIVESQMNNSIGYKLGNDEKLVCVTEHSLFLECVSNILLDDITHVLIDEAQERNVFTQLLLAYLKMILPKRKDLHLLVTTTPDCAETFSNFFYQCEIIKIDYPNYPVEIIWEIPHQNYVKAAVTKALDVLQLEENGDILVFLPNAFDVNFAFESVAEKLRTKTDVNVHKLLLTYNFDQTYKNVQQSTGRNIIFTTGEEEKIISLPNVRFVVDSGLSTEFRYEINHKFIETKFITLSSAEFRATAAGVSSPGKCYRFYSLEKLSGVNDEITAKLNIDLLVLCTLSLGINPNLFDFFSPLPKENICESLKKLEKINAVEKNVITCKGRQLIQFPLSLHLSNILLEGIARRIEYETLCFVAVSSTMHMYTVLTPETSNLKMKNTMELLKNYMEWYGKSSVERENFLTKIKINVRDTMKMINEKVIELHSVLKETFPAFLLQSTNSSWKFQLEKLIATCWLENLCILQHDDVYLWKLQKKFIHVLSSFASRDDCPSCLIFESLLKMRSGECIINFIPLDENVVENDENFGMVNTKKKSMREKEIIVRPVGHHILSTGFLGSNCNLKIMLEKKLSQFSGSTVKISVSQNKGEIKIQCGERDKEKVRDEIGKKIEKIQKKITKELWEFCICEQTGMRIVWGEKAQVVQFLMPSDFLTVIVFAPPIMSTDKIIQSFNKYGQIVHYNEKIAYNKKKQINIMFDNPTSAKDAVAHEEKGLTTKPRLENVCQQNKMQYFVELKIQWTRRLNLGSATIEFDKYPSYLYGKIKCYPDTLKKYDGCRLTLQNLDVTLSKEEIVSKIEAELIDNDIKIKNCNLLLEPGFQSTLEDLNEIKVKLNSLVMPILGENDVEILVEEPNLNYDIWTATVFFNNYKLLRLLLDSIREKTLDGRRLRLTVNYSCCVFCGSELFDTVKNEFQVELKKRQTIVEKKIANMKVQTTAIEDSGKIAVEIVGDDFDEVIFWFQCLATRLRSYTFNMSDYELLREKFYDDDERQEMLNKFSKNANAFVGYNKFSNQISVVDNPEVVGNMRRQLQLEIANSDFLDEAVFSCSSPSGTIRELVKLYNRKLTGLKKITGVVHVELNITSKNIKVKGDNEAVNKIKGILKSIKFKLNTSKPSNVKKDSIDECPICSDDVDKAGYNYRMEMCGHFYCFPCVTALIANSNPPICCLFKGCSKPIVFRDLSYLYQKCPLVVRNLADKTTFQYFKKNMDGFLFCVLPDCDGILSRADEENYCVKCFNKICIRCEVIYHYGQTCEEYKKKYPKTKSPVEFNAVPSMVSTNVTAEKPKKRYSFDEIIQKSEDEFDAASSTKVTAEKPKKTDPFEIIQPMSGSKSKLPIIFPTFSLEDFTMEVPIEENTCTKFNKKPHNDDPDFHSSSIFSREKSDPFLKSASEYNFETKKQTASKKLPPMCELENSSITGDKTRQSTPLIGESSNRPTSLSGTFSSSRPGVGYLPSIEASRSSGINSNSYSSNYANSTRGNSSTVKSEYKYSNSKRENYSTQKLDSNTFGRPKPPKKDDKCMTM